PYYKTSSTHKVWRPKPGKDKKGHLGFPWMYDGALQALVKLDMEKVINHPTMVTGHIGLVELVNI
ncbi:MAG: hypothetical protein O4803_14515, partial [Trichodesmium sp. St15_bin1_1]|nr:hypothetical protein [Trichodesmium sp. St15_bin1_1]